MRLVIFFLFAFALSIQTYAQSLKGYVYELDERNQKVPLIGANIYWQGTQFGTTTDENGFFELKKVNSDPLNLSCKLHRLPAGYCCYPVQSGQY